MRKRAISGFFAIIFIISVFVFFRIDAGSMQGENRDEKVIEIARNLKISNGEPDIQIYRTGRNRSSIYQIDLMRKAFIPNERVALSFSLPKTVNLAGNTVEVELSLLNLDGEELEMVGKIKIEELDDLENLEIIWMVPNLFNDEYIFAAKFYDAEGRWIFSKSDIIFISSEYPKLLEQAKRKVSEAANSIKDSNYMLKEVSLPSLEMIIKDAEIRWATFRKEDEDMYDIRNMLNEAMKLSEVLKNGRDPFESSRGGFVKAYRSDLDGSLQPYAVYVPLDYAPSKSYPLVIGLHGATSTHVNFLKRIFGMSNKPGESDEEAIKYFRRFEPLDFIVATPYGRGTRNSYYGIGEIDVLNVLELMKKAYNIDINRIYLTGLSMGGDGTWSIGLHYPDIFAAISPVCAPSNPFLRRVDYIESYDKKIANLNSSVNIAENAFNLPVYIHHGDMDPTVVVNHARDMVNRFKELGYYNKNVRYAEYPGVPHSSWVHAYRDARMFEWFKKFERNPYPKHVIYKTGNSKYNKAYWVKIDDFSKIREFAFIEGKIDGQNIDIKVNNVDRYTLTLNDNLINTSYNVNVVTNGINVYNGRIPKSGEISFSAVKDQSGKVIRYTRDNTPFKKRLLSDISGGRIFRMYSQAHLSKHIYVYGTSGTQEQTDLLKEAATMAADWSYGTWANWKVKKDIDITKEEIEENSLILFGCPETNQIIARINDELPIRIENEIIIKGSERFQGRDKSFKLVYPNPENENKFVTIYGVQTENGLKTLQNFSGTNPDYIILNEDGGKISAGLFDKNWNF
ncbi:prolyl oligopeptidase family serine peptidase [candidate division KSB1 bacterium]